MHLRSESAQRVARLRSFTCDSLNRIATAKTNADNQPAFSGDGSLAEYWAETYGYDAW